MPFYRPFLLRQSSAASYSTVATLIMLILFTIIGFIVSAQNQVQKNDYRVQYFTADRIFCAQYFFNTRDGGTVITGKIGYSDDSSKLFVMKTDRFGNALWTKYIPNQKRITEYTICETADGNIVFAGNSYLNPAPANANIYFYRFGCNGQLIWSRMLSVPGLFSNSSMKPYGLREGRNSDVIFSLSNSSSVTADQIALICRINAGGDLVWSKSYQGFDANTTEYANSSFYVNDKIVVFGFKRISSNFYDYQRRLFAMRLNYETGDMEFIRGYAYSEFQTNYSVLFAASKVHFDVSQLSGNRFAIYGLFANGSKTEGYFYKIIIGADLLINSALAYSIPVSPNGGGRKIAVFSNGEVHITAAVNNDTYNNPNVFWYTTDSNNVVKKSVVFGTGYEVFASQFDVAQHGATGSNYAVGLASNTATKMIVQAASFENDNAEMRACLQTRDTAVITQVSFNPGYQAWTWTDVKTGTALLSPLAAVAEDVQVTTTFLCKGTNYQLPGLSCNAALPVKLVAFTGEALSSGNQLKWTMEEDGNAEKHVLQSSEDGLNFTDVFTQRVQEATGKHSYIYFDKFPYKAAAIQYRIQTTLRDGSKTYSIRLTLRRLAAAASVSLYPNPAQHTVSVAGDFQPGKIEWFAANGVLVKSVAAPAIGQAIDVTDLPKGLYLVRIYHQGTIFNTKMIRN